MVQGAHVSPASHFRRPAGNLCSARRRTSYAGRNGTRMLPGVCGESSIGGISRAVDGQPEAALLSSAGVSGPVSHGRGDIPGAADSAATVFSLRSRQLGQRQDGRSAPGTANNSHSQTDS